MKTRAVKQSARRRPTQQRAQATVEAVLDAAVKLLKRQGSSSMTTNRIAETAGVSIGSVYQYFPNKRAIFEALHQRHVQQVDDSLMRRLDGLTDEPFEELVSNLVLCMVQLHSSDPELSELLRSEVPHGVAGTAPLAVRLYQPVRRMLKRRATRSDNLGRLNMHAFFLSNMLDAFGHAIVVGRPSGISLAAATAETVQAITSYMKC